MADRITDERILLLSDPQVKRAFRNDLAKLISFVKGRLPPNADNQTWEEFIVWQNVNPMAPEGQALKRQFDVWLELENQLSDYSVQWETLGNEEGLWKLFTGAFNENYISLLQDPLVLQYFKARLPNFYALIRKEIPKEPKLSFRVNAFLLRMMERGTIKREREAKRVVKELQDLKDLYRALITNKFPSWALEDLAILMDKYISDVDFADLFYGDFPNLYNLSANIVSEGAGIQLRAMCYVFTMGRKMKGLEQAKETYDEILRLREMEDLYFIDDFEFLAKCLDVYFQNGEFKRLFPSQFSNLEILAGTKALPEDAGLYVKTYSLLFQAYKKNEIPLDAAKEILESTRLFIMPSTEHISQWEKWLENQRFYPQLTAQIAELHPQLNALTAQNPAHRALFLISDAYKQGAIKSDSAAEKLYSMLLKLLKLENKDQPLSMDEKGNIAQALLSFISGKKWKKLLKVSEDSLRELIPQAFHFSTPHEDDPYFVSAVHYTKSAKETWELLGLLLTIKGLDDALPIMNDDQLEGVSKLVGLIFEKIDENTRKFLQSKVPYAVYAMDMVKANKTEELTFKNRTKEKVLQEELRYYYGHGRSIGISRMHRAFGDCSIEIDGKMRKVASWFIKTALPESAYEIKNGRLRFTGDWSGKECSQILSYCYKGWFFDEKSLDLSFAKKAKEQGLNDLYRS
ncbi:MAG: hypothetical protein ACK5MA_03140, partial [Parachlamydiaceae bacterium]